MATGVVNRQEWAKVVQSLLIEFTKGKKATFARLIGFDPTTIGNWLRGDVAVSEGSVRQVAERTGRNAMDLLIQVGFYRVEEMPRYPDEVIDEEQLAVLDNPDLTDEQKAFILRELDAMRETDERLLAEQRERDRQRRADRIAVLIANSHNSR